MKVASSVAKNTITPYNSSKQLKQKVDGILSKITGKARIGKAKLQQPLTSCNNKNSVWPFYFSNLMNIYLASTSFTLASRIRLQSPAKHKTAMKPGPEKHSSKAIISLEQDKNTKRQYYIIALTWSFYYMIHRKFISDFYT